MTLAVYRQLRKLIADEVNVKRVAEKIAETDKGALILVYQKEPEDVFLTLNGVRIDKPKLLNGIVELL